MATRHAMQGFFRSRWGILWLVALAGAAYALLSGHATHVLAVLPYLLVFACPLMHVFGHGRHGHHHHGHGAQPEKDRAQQP